MRESTIESRVSEFAKSKGWFSYKWSSPNVRGVPDRIYLKRLRIVFVEFKAPRKKPSKLQHTQLKLLSNFGFHACVIDSVEDGLTLFQDKNSGKVNMNNLLKAFSYGEGQTENIRSFKTADTEPKP